MKKIITHLVAAYVGAGLFGGLVMQAAVPPMNNFGVAFYGFTWPAFLVCARTEVEDCNPFDHIPVSVQALMFTFEEKQDE